MSSFRIRFIGLIFSVALLVVWGRVAYLQLALGPWHRATMADAEVRTRLIPAPRGTIRAADGTVLARDRCDADLAVHFRFLERPVDESWLEQQARARLTRRERRITERVEQAKDELRHEIESAWQALAELTATPEPTLDARARVVQHRVARIVDSVNRRRRERWEREAARNSPHVTLNDGSDEPARADSNNSWHRIIAWLADAPPRPTTEPQPVSVVEQDRYYTLVENVAPEVVFEFSSNPQRFPGIRLEQRIRREYPAGDVACSIIGFTEPPNDAEDDPVLFSGAGRTGVEGFYESELRGVPGHVREQLAARGGAPRALGGLPPQPGHDVALTIDLDLEQFAESCLDRALEQEIEVSGARHRATSGAIVVLDVRTGAVLAAAAAPRFDLNEAARPTSDAAQELARRDDAPMFNRVIQMSLAPGSTFKPVTAVAALKHGVNPRDGYFCRGYLHEPDKFRCLVYRHFGVGHESVTMTDAIVRSCNVYFFHLSEQLGGAEIVRWADAFGYGRATGIDLAGEEPGNVPAVTRSPRGGSVWSDGETKGVAIGQGSMSATPLQVAVMMAAIANGGSRVVPHVRRDAFQPPRPIDGLDGASDRSLAVVRHALAQVVTDPHGTGHANVYLADVEIAGKTGTAQSGSPRGDHAWFAGYVPAREPRFAVVAVLEHAGSGGHAAGPLAREIVKKMLELGYVSRSEPLRVSDSAPLDRPRGP